MKETKSTFKIINFPEYEIMLNVIETAGRNCYQSPQANTIEGKEKFIRNLIKNGHHSVIEHCYITIEVTYDRGISAEMNRHRLLSISEKSTRYCNFSKDKFGSEIKFILPDFIDISSDNKKACNTPPDIIDDTTSNIVLNEYEIWQHVMKTCEWGYLTFTKIFEKPAQEARNMLPLSLETTTVLTCNIREWRHILTLRTSKDAHPQIRQLCLDILDKFYEKSPVFFEDIYELRQKTI